MFKTEFMSFFSKSAPLPCVQPQLVTNLRVTNCFSHFYIYSYPSKSCCVCKISFLMYSLITTPQPSPLLITTPRTLHSLAQANAISYGRLQSLLNWSCSPSLYPLPSSTNPDYSPSDQSNPLKV